MNPKKQKDIRLAECTALVVDGNAVSRGVIAQQLREFGMTTVDTASKPNEARSKLETKPYEIVLCEQTFPGTTYTGQELLDDLRRTQVLPYGTVFVMLTAEASYAQVAEAAESALDSYLLKPHTATGLLDRLKHAHRRKIILADIFEAIEAGHFATAIEHCIKRYQGREHYWLYAGRVAAELLMREGKHDEAADMYHDIAAQQALPWARLGIARAKLEAGNPEEALVGLSQLAKDLPNFADTYDVLVRLHLDESNFPQALVAARRACEISPAAIERLQMCGMLAYSQGEFAEAAAALDRATMLGLTSKLYDPQSLMLLAFARLQLKDTQGIKRCVDHLQKLLERKESPPRLVRFKALATTLLALANRQLAAVVEQLKAHASEINASEFDVEAACNLLTLISEIGRSELALEAAGGWVNTLALRFCGSNSVTEMLANAATRHPPFEAAVREAHQRIETIVQEAIAQSANGKPTEALRALLMQSDACPNLKLLATARLIVERHHAQVSDATAIEASVRERLSVLAPSGITPPMLQAKGRGAGGLTLRAAKATTQPKAIAAPLESGIGT